MRISSYEKLIIMIDLYFFMQTYITLFIFLLLFIFQKYYRTN